MSYAAPIGPTPSAMMVRDEVIDKEILQRYVALSLAEYKDHPVCDIRHLSWKYLENPFGASTAVNLYLGDELVGRATYQPRKFRCNGKEYHAVQFVDLLIHPKHRKLKNFALIVDHLKSFNKADFVFCCANNQSGPLLESYLKLSPLVTLEGYILPLSCGGLERPIPGIAKYKVILKMVTALLFCFRLVASTVLRVLSFFSKNTLTERVTAHEIDCLFEDVSSQGLLVGDRANQFHDWRFFGDPSRQCVTRYLIDSKQRLVGYVAWRISTMKGLRILLVVDLVLSRTANCSDVAKLWLSCYSHAKRADCDIIAGFFNIRCNAQRRLVFFPFIHVPSRLLARTFGVLFRESAVISEGLPSACGIYFSLADLDVG